MSLQVSSWFLEQSRAQQAEPQRRFTLGGRDFSARVLRWPSLAFKAGTIDLGTATVRLSNVGRPFGFLVDCDHLLTTSAEVALGFAHPDSGTEWISLFLGTPSHVAFARGGAELRLQLQGKTRRLTDTSLGSAAESAGLDFTGSAHYPADLAWTLVTCHGGMSAIQSDSNPDIHYGEWRAWRDANVVRDVRVRAYLTGERIYQVLAALATMDSRLVSFHNARLRFSDAFQPFGASNPPLPPGEGIARELMLDPARIVNHFFVEADYDPAKARFAAAFSKVHSASQQRFGVRSGRFSARGVWFAGGPDARYLAEDRIRFGHRPHPLLAVRSPLGGVAHTVGDVVSVTDSHFGLAGRAFRLVEQRVDLDAGLVELRLLETLHRAWQFQGTVSSANLLVRTLTAIGSERWLALEDTPGPGRLYRSDSDGLFQPGSLQGTAVLAIDAQQVLLGGPPSSGETQAVLQRSPDGGQTAVVVSSLDPNVTVVHAIHEVASGTYLASANSGAIYRSTDGGSSWNRTDTISGAYHVSRFHAPRSGTLWGGTGFSDAGLGTGLYIWESTDEGQTWAPRHTVYSGGTYVAAGFATLSGSEWLLGHHGNEIGERGVLRARWSSAESIAWLGVFSAAGFSEVVQTPSGHLLFGFHEETTLAGGAVYRSLDQGSAWFEDARLAKQGNIRLVDNGDGTHEAFVARMSMGPRTDRYRTYEPDVLN